MIPKQQNRKIIKCRFFNNFFLVCFRDVYILICMNGCLGWIVQKTLSSLSIFWRGRECTVPVVENGSWGKVSKKAAEVWWCSRWLCQPCLLPCLYNPHRLGAFQRAAAQLHPGEMLQVSPPTLPGGPRVEHASGRCGTPEEGWRPVKSNPGPCKDSSVQCKVANKN